MDCIKMVKVIINLGFVEKVLAVPYLDGENNLERMLDSAVEATGIKKKKIKWYSMEVI